MLKKDEIKTVIVAGLKNAGKTTIICDFIDWNNKQLSNKWSVFKPFDCGQFFLNQQDALSDGEIFVNLIPSNKPHVSTITPYMAYKQAPFEYAISEDLNQPNFSKIDACLQKISANQKKVWIESPGSWYSPIASNMSFVDWAKKVSSAAVWVMQADRGIFDINLSQIILMKENFINIAVIINNYPVLRDEKWLNYCWKKIEFEFKVPVIGLYQEMNNKYKNHNINIIKNGYQKFA